jgi:hypothetical protein
MKNNFQKLKEELQEGKKDYEIYHKTYSSAVSEMVKFAEKNGFTIDEDDMFSSVTTGPGKPSAGQTGPNLILNKGDKQSKKRLAAQVYGMDSGSHNFELNMYI